MLWVEEMFGAKALVAAGKVHPTNATTGIFSAFALSGISSSSADCIHEDGGAHAIFERIEQEHAVKVTADPVVSWFHRLMLCTTIG